jgi:hypothetical protein
MGGHPNLGVGHPHVDVRCMITRAATFSLVTSMSKLPSFIINTRNRGNISVDHPRLEHADSPSWQHVL